MLEIPPALVALCQRHHISDDLPTDLFLERCVSAIESEQNNLQEVQKSVAHRLDCQAKFMPNPGITRDEKVGVVDEPTSRGDDKNSCFDSSFPWLL